MKTLELRIDGVSQLSEKELISTDGGFDICDYWDYIWWKYGIPEEYHPCH